MAWSGLVGGERLAQRCAAWRGGGGVGGYGVWEKGGGEGDDVGWGWEGGRVALFGGDVGWGGVGLGC